MLPITFPTALLSFSSLSVFRDTFASLQLSTADHSA